MEDKYINGIIIATIAILVGLAFWSTIGSSVGTLTAIQTSTNASFTFPGNGTTTDLTTCGQLNTSAVVIFNTTNGTAGFQNLIVPVSNYTITQAAGADGFLSTRIAYNGGGVDRFGGFADNVTCTYQPRGYIAEGGSRSVVLLIPIFFALLIAIAAIPDLREWIKNGIGYS